MRNPFRTLGFKTTPARIMGLRSLTVPHQRYFPFSLFGFIFSFLSLHLLDTFIFISRFLPSWFSVFAFGLVYFSMPSSYLHATCPLFCLPIPICRRGASPSSHSFFLLFIFFVLSSR